MEEALLDKTEGLWCAGSASAVRATLLRGAHSYKQAPYGGVGGGRVGWVLLESEAWVPS